MDRNRIVKANNPRARPIASIGERESGDAIKDGYTSRQRQPLDANAYGRPCRAKPRGFINNHHDEGWMADLGVDE